jgi:hypothetical protein
MLKSFLWAVGLPLVPSILALSAALGFDLSGTPCYTYLWVPLVVVWIIGLVVCSVIGVRKGAEAMDEELY